jgi:hypothetical protein
MVIDNTNIVYVSSSSVSNRIKGCNVVQRATLTKTWGGGNSHCLLLGGRLCNRDEYCPNGRGSAPLGGYKKVGTTSIWAPVLDAVNTWVLLSNETNDEPCALNIEIDSSTNGDAVYNPSWGRSRSASGTGFVKCCEVPYTSRTSEDNNDFDKCSVPTFTSNQLLTPVSNTSSSGNNAIGNAFDNNANTFWSSLNNERLISITVDLGETTSGYIHCIEKITLKWNEYYSPDSYVLVSSIDGVGYFFAEKKENLGNQSDRLDEILFSGSNNYVHARYIQFQTDTLPQNKKLWLEQFSVYGDLCELPLQARGKLSFDFGPKNQAAIQSGYQAFSLTTTGTNTNIVKKTISDSTGALMGVSNKYIDIILGCPLETEYTKTMLNGVESNIPITGTVPLPDTLRDGIMSPGASSISVLGLTPGYYTMATQSHEVNGRSSTRYEVFANQRSLGHGTVSTTGYGNLDDMNNDNFGKQMVQYKMPKSTNTNGESIELHVETNEQAFNSKIFSNLKNGKYWKDSDNDGVADDWKISNVNTYAKIKSARCNNKNFLDGTKSFIGRYQFSQAKVSELKIWQENAIQKNVMYKLTMRYKSNASTLSSGNSAYELSNWYPHHISDDENPGLYMTTIVSATDTELSFQANGERAYLEIDDVELIPIFEEIDEIDTWDTASNICSTRNMKLCSYDEICLHGAGYNSVFGNLRASTGAGEGTEWLPVTATGKSAPYLVLSTKSNTSCSVIDNPTFQRTVGTNGYYDKTNNLFCCKNEENCKKPMGMENGDILTSQLYGTGSASGDTNGRLNGNIKGWYQNFPSGSPGNVYYGINFQKTVVLNAVATQGGADGNPSVDQWMETYKIKYSLSEGDSTFTYIKGYVGDKVFTGNTDRDTVVTNTFDSAIVAQYVRIYPETLSADSGTAVIIRFEFYGGQVSTCSATFGYGSIIYIKSAGTNKYLDSSTAKFDGNVANTNAAFMIMHPRAPTEIPSTITSIKYGDRFMLRSIRSSNQFFSYNVGDDTSADANIVKQPGTTEISSNGTDADSRKTGPVTAFDDVIDNTQYSFETLNGYEYVYILANFKAKYAISNVKVYWGGSTTSTLFQGPADYTLERSNDGVTYITIASKSGLDCGGTTVGYTRTDTWSKWAEPTQYLRLSITKGCGTANVADGYKLLEYQVYGRPAVNTTESAMTSGTGMNTTFQLIDARIQLDTEESSTSCTPTEDQITVKSKQEDFSQMVFLRMMSTKTSFGCFLSDSMAPVAFGNAGILDNKFYFEAASSGNVIINRLDLTTNATQPAQVHGVTFTEIDMDTFDASWIKPLSYNGPSIDYFNVTRSSNVFLIQRFSLYSNVNLDSNKKYIIKYYGISSGCLAWDVSETDLATALHSKIVEFGDVSITRFTSAKSRYGYDWDVTFTSKDNIVPNNISIELGTSSTCSNDVASNNQKNAWVQTSTLRSQRHDTEIQVINATYLTWRFDNVTGRTDHSIQIAAKSALGQGLFSHLKILSTSDPQVPAQPQSAISIISGNIGATNLNVELSKSLPQGAEILRYAVYLRYVSSNSFPHEEADRSGIDCIHFVNREVSFQVQTQANLRLGSFGTATSADFDIDNYNLTQFVDSTNNNNKLFKTTVLTFEVFVTSVDFIPDRFVLTQEDSSNSATVTIDLAVPPGGYKTNTWQTVQEGIPNAVYKNSDGTDWTNTAQPLSWWKNVKNMAVYRSGAATVTDSNQYIKLRNVRFCAGVYFTDTAASSFTLLGLESQTKYKVKYAAINFKGKGAFSPESTEFTTTDATVPDKIEYASIASTIYSDEIHLSWALPYSGGQSIQKYVVKASSQQNEVQVVSVYVTQGSFKLKGNGSITDCISWNADATRVESALNAISTAIGTVSVNTWTNTSVARKLFVAFQRSTPGNVAELEAFYYAPGVDCSGAGESSQAKLSVEEFVQGGAVSDLVDRPEESTVTKIELKNLKGASRYVIKIAAVNSVSSTDILYSDDLVIFTKIMGVPYGNTELLLDTVTVSGAQLNWNLPRDNGTPIISYGLHEKILNGEVQEIIAESSSKDIASGKFSLVYQRKRSACLNWNAAVSDVETALNGIGFENVTVSRTEISNRKTKWKINFDKKYGNIETLQSTGHMALLPWGFSATHSTAFSTVKDEAECGNIISVHSISNSTTSAFAALRQDGTILSWGDVNHELFSAPIASDTSTDYVKVVTNEMAFAALSSDNTIVSWGNSKLHGSNMPDNAKIALRKTGVDIFATGSAFAGLRYNGTVICWGNTAAGGDCSSIDLINVKTIFNTRYAFAALTTKGGVISWGDSANGGTIESSRTTMLSSGVTAIIANDYAFVALKYSKIGVPWGNAIYGGDGSTLVYNVDTIVPSKGAFAALHFDDTVTAWGSTAHGGDCTTTCVKLVEITKIYSNAFSFAAINRDGNVSAWGDTNKGGTAPSSLGDIVEIYSAPFLTPSVIDAAVFAAKNKNGQITTWGTADQGGDTADVTDGFLDNSVETVFCNQHACVARNANGDIKTWPSNTNGGDLSVSDKAFLDDSVASVHVAYNAFVALCKNAFVASDSTRESAVFTQNTAIDCSGCLGATSGCCQDINMVCADYMTGTSVCPYNMYDCNGESVRGQISVYETIKGRNSFVSNPSFEIDDGSYISDFDRALPYSWSGDVGSYSGEYGARMIRSGSIFANGVSATDGSNFVALERSGSLVEQKLFNLVVNEEYSIQVSFSSLAGGGSDQTVDIYLDKMKVFGPVNPPSNSFQTYTVSFTPLNSSAYLKIINSSPNSPNKKVIFVDNIISHGYTPRFWNSGSTNQSYYAPELNGDSSYTFSITGTNIVGRGLYGVGNTTTTTSGTVPGQVTNVVVSNIGVDNVHLCWSKPASNGADIFGYKIESSVDNAAYVTHNITTGNVATCETIYSLLGGSSYKFKLTAINNKGFGTTSAETTAINTLTATVPASYPAIPTILNILADSVTLSWPAHVKTGGDALTSYKIEKIGKQLEATLLTMEVASASTTYKFTVTLNGKTSSCTSWDTPTDDLRNAITELMSPSWTDCNFEGHICNVSQTPSSLIKYISTGGDYVVSGPHTESVRCERNSFAYDPNPSQTKRCQITESKVHIEVVSQHSTKRKLKIIALNSLNNTESQLSTLSVAKCETNDFQTISLTSVYGPAMFSDVATALDTENGNILTAKIDNLYGLSLYKFRISAINSNGGGVAGPWTKLVLTKNPLVPAQVKGVSVLASNSYYITIKWDKPSHNGDKIIGYRIKWKRQTATITTLSSVFEVYNSNTESILTEYNVTNVEANGKYNFVVAGINSIGTGVDSIEASFPMHQMVAATVPDVVRDQAIQVAAEPTTVNVTFNEPFTGGSAISSYSVQFRKTSDAFADLATSQYAVIRNERTSLSAVPVINIQITGLEKGMEYYFQFKATNSEGAAAGYGVQSNVTKSSFSLPSQPKNNNVERLAVGSTWMNFTWGELTDIGGTPIIAYKIGSKKQTENTISYQPSTSDSGVVTCDSASEIANRYCVVNGLEPGSNYIFRLWAINIAGESDYSGIFTPVNPGLSSINFNFTIPTAEPYDETKLKTRLVELYPMSLSKITAELIQTTTSPAAHKVAVWWKKIALYRPLSENFKTDNKFFSDSDTTITTLDAEYKEYVYFRTNGLSVPETIVKPEIVATHEFSITIKWQIPENGGSTITGYDIQTQLNGGSFVDYLSITTGQLVNNLYVATNLLKGQRYRFKVRAKSSVGLGVYSDASDEATTIATIPREVTNLNVAKIRPTYVILNWNAPVDEGGLNITGYQINQTQDNNLNSYFVKIATTGSRSESTFVTGLTQASTYKFRVAAINQLGVGIPVTIASSIQTLTAQFPGPTGKPQINEIPTNVNDQGSVNVSWAPPQFNGGATITDYQVFLRENVQEVQVITLTAGAQLQGGESGGQFKLNYEGVNTTCVNWDDTADQLADKLKAMTSIDKIGVSRSNITQTGTYTKVVYTITFLNPKGDRPNFGVFKGYNIGTKCASGKHGTGQEGVNCYFPFKYDSIEYTAGNCRRYGVGGAYAYTKAENEEHFNNGIGRGWCPTHAPNPANDDFFFSENQGFTWGSCMNCPLLQCKVFRVNDVTIVDDVNITVVEGQKGEDGPWKTNLPGTGFLGSTKTNSIISSIVNGRMVDVKVKAANSISTDGEEEFTSEPIVIKQGYPASLSGSNYQVLETTTDYVTLQWNRPSLNGTSFIVGYRIYGRKWTQEEAQNASSKEFVVMVEDTGNLFGTTVSYVVKDKGNNLDRASFYEFCVVILNGITPVPTCGTASGDHSQATQILSKVPDPIKIFAINGKMGTGQLEIQYEIPQIGGVPTTKYIVYVDENANELQSITMRNRTEIKAVHQFKYAFRGVETACIEYNKEVSFIENQIKGLSTISDVKVTDVIFPSKMRYQSDKGIARILNIEFIGNDGYKNIDGKISLTFCNDPEANPKPIFYVDATIVRKEGKKMDGQYDVLTEIASNATDTAGALVKRSIYQPKGGSFKLKVSGVNSAGIAPPSDEVLHSMSNYSLPGIPEIYDISKTATSFSFSVRVNDVGGYYIIGYSTKITNTKGFSNEFVSEATTQTVSQTGLAFGTSYTIVVTVFGVSGTRNTTMVMTTEAKIPGKVPGVPEISNVTKTGLKLSWMPPTDIGGSNIIGYQIQSKKYHRTSAYTDEVQVIRASGPVDNSKIRFKFNNQISYCFDITVASDEKVKFALQGISSLNSLNVVRSSNTSGIQAGFFDYSWTVTFTNNRGNLPLIEFDSASACSPYNADKSFSVTELIEGKNENPYIVHVSNTNNTNTTISLQGLELGTIYLFRVAAFNAIGLANEFSLPSEPRESTLNFALFLSGFTVESFNAGNQTQYRQTISLQAGVNISQVIIKTIAAIKQDIQSSSSRRRRRLLEIISGINVVTAVQNISSSEATNIGNTLQTLVTDTTSTGLSSLLQSANVNVNTLQVTEVPRTVTATPTPLLSTVPDKVANAPTVSNGGGAKQLVLLWTAPYDGGSYITRYDIYVNGNFYTKIEKVGSETVATQALVSGLTPGTSYTFKVAAVNIHGSGEQSPAMTHTTLALASPPSLTGNGNTLVNGTSVKFYSNVTIAMTGSGSLMYKIISSNIANTGDAYVSFTQSIFLETKGTYSVSAVIRDNFGDNGNIFSIDVLLLEPEVQANEVTLTNDEDSNNAVSQFSGSGNIVMPTSGATQIQLFNVYWADWSDTPVSSIILTVPNCGQSTCPWSLSDVAIPASPANVSKLIFRSANDFGESVTSPAFLVIYDSGATTPTEPAMGVEVIDLHEASYIMTGQINVYHPLHSTTVHTYSIFWGYNETIGTKIADLPRIKNGVRYVSYNISDLTLPLGATHIFVKTVGKSGEVHETIVKGRILDRVHERLTVPYSNSSTYMSIWLENGNAAVICRVAAPGKITSTAIFYTNNDKEANDDGSFARQAPVIRTKKASYYYFATKAKLKSLSTTGFTLKSSFNNKMMIDCAKAG